MPTYPSHLRKLKAVELVVQVERMKDKADRDLDIDSIIERAKKLDVFTKEYQ